MNMIGLTNSEIKNLIETVKALKGSKVDNVNNLFDVAVLVTSFSKVDLMGLRNFCETLRLFKDFLENISQEEIEKFKNLKMEVIKNGTNDKCNE